MFLGVQKFIKKNCVVGWLLLSFQGTYIRFHLKLIYKFFGVRKLKMYQGQYGFSHCYKPIFSSSNYAI